MKAENGLKKNDRHYTDCGSNEVRQYATKSILTPRMSHYTSLHLQRPFRQTAVPRPLLHPQHCHIGLPQPGVTEKNCTSWNLRNNVLSYLVFVIFSRFITNCDPYQDGLQRGFPQAIVVEVKLILCDVAEVFEGLMEPRTPLCLVDRKIGVSSPLGF